MSIRHVCAYLAVLSVATAVSAAPVILDPGFEFPVQPVNQWEQAGGAGGGTLVGANWAFSSSAGIMRDVSAFQGGGVVAPEGSQFALIQAAGTITQTLSGFDPGKLYQLIVSQRARSGQTNDLQIRMDGQLVGAGRTNNMNFSDYSTPFFTVASAGPVLEFAATNPAGGDKTTFFDNVRIAEVTVSGPTLTNPGFEDGVLPASPGYGMTSGWTSSSTERTGVNDASGPFLNGQAIPEGSRVGFIQYTAASTNSLSQMIAGLTPGQRYQLIYDEGERGQSGAVAGGSATLDGATTIVPFHQVRRLTGMHEVHSLPFVATASTAGLTVSNTSVAGDNTLLLDNFRIRLLDGPVVGDSGFESPIQPDNNWEQATGAGGGTLVGSLWTFAGGAGITRNISAFQSNSHVAPEGVQHAILQGRGARMTQTIDGFIGGVQYQLSLLTMARQHAQYGNDLEVILDLGLPTERMILDMSEVTFNKFTEVLSDPFMASKDSYTLTIRADLDGGRLTGDRTTFVDDVQINILVPEPCTLALTGLVVAGLGGYVRRRRHAGHR